MKRMIIAIMAMLTITVSATAMSYDQARREALFLTDKMAYELNLTNEQYDAAYEINLDYLMGVSGRDDVFGTYWTRRNLDISYILLDWQWRAFRAATYFYRPLYWHSGYWRFGIYARYPRRDYFYFGRPTVYVSYRGGHSWRSNGGRSYYHGRKHDFHRGDGHHGMRDKWDKGDFNKNNGHGKLSSTHVTAKRGDKPNTDKHTNGNGKNGNGFGGSRTNVTLKDNKTNITTIKKRTLDLNKESHTTTVSGKHPGFSISKGTDIRKKETTGSRIDNLNRNTGKLDRNMPTMKQNTSKMSRSTSTVNKGATKMSRHSSAGAAMKGGGNAGKSHGGGAKGRFGGSR